MVLGPCLCFFSLGSIVRLSFVLSFSAVYDIFRFLGASVFPFFLSICLSLIPCDAMMSIATGYSTLYYAPQVVSNSSHNNMQRHAIPPGSHASIPLPSGSIHHTALYNTKPCIENLHTATMAGKRRREGERWDIGAWTPRDCLSRRSLGCSGAARRKPPANPGHTV